MRAGITACCLIVSQILRHLRLFFSIVFIEFCNSIPRVLSVIRKYFLYLWCWIIWQTYWKCFRTVLVRKCGSFNEERTHGQHSFLCRLMSRRSNVCFLFDVSIQVWGIGCRLFSLRLYHSLLADKRNRLHTFFLYN